MADTKQRLLDHRLASYGIALAAILAAFLLREGMVRYWEHPLPPYITFYPAVILTALFAGLGPALLATGAAALLADYWILEPRGQWTISDPGGAIGLALFVSMGIVVGLLAERHKHTLQRLADYQKELALQKGRETLRESEERWATTLRSIGDAVVATDAAGRIAFANPLAESLLEVGADECLGKSIDDIFKVVNEQTGDPLENPVARAVRLNRVIELGNNAVLLGNKGARTPIADSAAPIRDALGQMTGVVLVFRDVTERRRRDRERAEALLREQVQRQIAEDTASRLRKIESVTESMLAHLPFDTMLQQLLRRTAETVQADVAAILLLDERTQMLEVRAALGLDEEIREGVHIPLGRGVAGTIAATGQLRIIENLSEADVFSPYLREKSASLMGAPLVVEDRVIGVIHVDSRQPRKFTDAEAALLQVVADRVALAIDRSRAEQRIAHLASFPELNPNFIFETDLAGTLTYANPAAQKQFPDLFQRGADHPLLKEWPAALDKFRNGAERTIVCDVETDGRVLQETIHHSPELRLVRGYLTDITARRRVEREGEIAVEFLRLVNDATATRDMIRAAVAFLQEQSGCEAVGIRLRDGDDYPYYEARGFPREFVLAENSLCTRNHVGEVIRDNDGHPLHECMCGNVICGRVDPAKPFFTARGSFWTDCTTELLAGSTEADRQSRTRNRCNGEGYESVALIPLRLGQEQFGLLQLNDRRKGRFSAEAVALWERLAGHLAVALAKFRAQEALRDSEMQFRTLANAIPQLCWMANADGWIFWYNQRWYEYTGATPELMEGWGWQSVHDPETLPKVLEQWKASIATGQPFNMVFPLRGADGEFRPFLTRVMPVKNADGQVVRWFGTNTDVAELRNVQEALRASEQRWAITLQSIGDAVISTDATGKIVFMNDVAQKLTGWPLAEVAGQDLSTVFNIVQEVTRIKPENPVSKVIRLGKVVGLANHTVLIGRGGTEIPIEDSGAPIRNREGQIEGVVLVFHDVSEQRRMEQAVRNNERLAITGRLAATIAHEIHNPLDTVGNLLFLVQQSTNDEQTRKHVSMASDELTRITQMTHQMLTFQRESAKPVPVDVGEILENVLALYQRKIESAAIRIEKEIDLPLSLLAQPGELRQVLANLLGNAIQAVDADHGKLQVRAYPSRDWRRGRSGIRVVIADNGRGIPAELQGKIFEPFFTTKGESGTGLGLWITTDIVSKYGGVMRLRSSTQPGRSGTCFSVFFPIPSTG